MNSAHNRICGKDKYLIDNTINTHIEKKDMLEMVYEVKVELCVHID